MPALVRRGPFSYDSLGRSGTNNYTLTNAKFDANNGEILEVIVDGAKIEGDGSVANSTDAGNQSPAHGFYVDSLTAPTKISLVSNGSDISSVKIYRLSNRTSAQVDFAPGSVIREQDLDNSTNQTLHVAQEAMDIALSGVVLASDDKWDGNSKVIKSVADGSADNDAVNKGQLTATELTTNDYKLEAKDWAQKVDGGVKVYSGGSVTGSEVDHAAKAWAIGGTGVTDTASKGAAKEWAIETSGNVDGTSYSAKEYAQGTQASTGGSAKSWAQDTDQVNGAGTNDRSAKAWSQGASMTGATLGGSAKDWAQLAEDSQVNGSEYSAKHYSAKSSASASAAAASETAARNSANSVTNILDNFGDKYLGTMSSSDTASTASITGAKWVKGGSQITNVTQASGTIEEGQVLTNDGSATGWPTTATAVSYTHLTLPTIYSV